MLPAHHISHVPRHMMGTITAPNIRHSSTAASQRQRVAVQRRLLVHVAQLAARRGCLQAARLTHAHRHLPGLELAPEHVHAVAAWALEGLVGVVHGVPAPQRGRRRVQRVRSIDDDAPIAGPTLLSLDVSGCVLGFRV